MLPVSTIAAPAAVEGVTATVESGLVIVEWEPVPAANAYRVYYSSRSILENEGAYDGFEETIGTATSHIFLAEMLTNKVFFAVVAVDAEGEESPIFLEEASVVLEPSEIDQDKVSVQAGTPEPVEPEAGQSSSTPTFTVTGPAQASSSAASSEPSAAAEPEPMFVPDGKLHLILAEATGPNEVQLYFNETPTVQPELAPQAFSIVDANGLPLRIRSIYIEGPSIAVETDAQVQNATYQVRLAPPLRGISGAPLHETDRKLVFSGHREGNVPQHGAAPTASSAASNPAAGPASAGTSACDPQLLQNPPPVTNLQLRAVAEGNNRFTVQSRWGTNFGACEPQFQYVVRQSVTRGRTFADPQTVPISIGGIDIPGVQSPEYGLGISVLSPLGFVSPEVFQTISIPVQPVAQPQPVPQQPAQVPQPQHGGAPAQSPNLPSSGPGAFALGAALAGGLLGRRLSRRK